MTWAAGTTRTSSAAHKAWARRVRHNAQGRCQIGYEGCTGDLEHADHIVPVAEGGPELDINNGQGACGHCHKIKTAAEAKRGQQRFHDRGRRAPEVHPSLRP